MTEKKLEKIYSQIFKKFDFNLNEVDLYEDTEEYTAYDVTFQLDDRLIEKHYKTFEKAKDSIKKELGIESATLERMDAFPNGYSYYKSSISIKKHINVD